jgi:hypothetical protein
MWNPEVQRVGARVWVRCGGCGDHFELRRSGASVSLVFHEHEEDRETIDFCSQACVDAAEARGSLVTGQAFGRLAIQDFSHDDSAA